MATGLILRTDGRGSHMRISVGPLITTVAGLISRITAGPGFPGAIWTGVQHGYPGGPVAIMSAGLRCRRAVQGLFIKDCPSVARWISSSISALSIITFSTPVLSVSRFYAI